MRTWAIASPNIPKYYIRSLNNIEPTRHSSHLAVLHFDSMGFHFVPFLHLLAMEAESNQACLIRLVRLASVLSRMEYRLNAPGGISLFLLISLFAFLAHRELPSAVDGNQDTD